MFNNHKNFGGGLIRLVETRPLEDILADIAVGWKRIKEDKDTRTPVSAYTSNYEL